MRILVTGLSGFIGSSLGPFLEARGHEVRGASRQVIALAAAMRGCDAVVHLANIAHGRVERILRHVNVKAPPAPHSSPPNRACAASSISARSGERPDDAYGRAKLAAEQALRRTAPRRHAAGDPAPAAGLWAGVKANFLALMRAVARGWPLPFASIDNRRSLLYVGNLADAVIALPRAPQACRQAPTSSADGPPVSTPELCRALGDALGRPARLFPFPARCSCCRLTQARATRSRWTMRRCATTWLAAAVHVRGGIGATARGTRHR